MLCSDAHPANSAYYFGIVGVFEHFFPKLPVCRTAPPQLIGVREKRNPMGWGSPYDTRQILPSFVGRHRNGIDGLMDYWILGANLSARLCEFVSVSSFELSSCAGVRQGRRARAHSSRRGRPSRRCRPSSELARFAVSERKLGGAVWRSQYVKERSEGRPGQTLA